MKLKPKTIRTSPTIQRIDCSIERPNSFGDPELFYTAHIDGLQCIVGTSPFGLPYSTAEVLRIDNCIDCSISHDGAWRRGLNDEKLFFTIGAPYVAYVNNLHTLYVQQLNGARTLIASNIQTVTLHRGWKHLNVSNSADQGLMALYAKREGGIFFRKLIDGAWQPENQIAEFGTALYTRIVSWLTNDYRTGISSGTMSVLSERSWAGLGIQGELLTPNELTVTGSATYVNQIAITPVELIAPNALNHTIKVLSKQQPSYFRGYAHSNTSMSLWCDIKLVYNTNAAYLSASHLNACLSIHDKNGTNCIIEDVTADFNTLHVTVTSLGLFEPGSDITISHDGGLLTTLGEAVQPFSYTFTPENIIYETVEPAEVLSAINVNLEDLV